MERDLIALVRENASSFEFQDIFFLCISIKVMDILVMHKIAEFIMSVLMVVIIDRCVLLVLVGNHSYAYVCQLILSVVKVRDLSSRHQV